ncbi:MAG: cytochrome c maturation protein CcmE [Desulfovibrio sp.]|nr:cytochrome c maturation protein CcmE [Desulfovibrio sp.]
MSRGNSTSLHLVAFLLFLGGTGYLCYSGFSENSIYFLNVSEARAVSADKLANVRLFGTVSMTDAERQTGDPAGIVFRLEDKDNAAQAILVRYAGAVPDTFRPGAEVIVEGGMGRDGRFTAKTLMTRCPSKYRKENRKG